MTTLRHGWFVGGLTALALTAWLVGSDSASAQTLKIQTQKSTAKDSTKKKELKNATGKPPAPAGNNLPKQPIVINNTPTKPAGLARITYAAPNTFAIYPISGFGGYYPNIANTPGYYPGAFQNPYLNPYQNVYPQQLPYYSNQYLTPYSTVSPLVYNSPYGQQPYYNSLYNNYGPNPFVNANPAFMMYNPAFDVAPNGINFNPSAFAPQFGSGGLLNGGLLYRGPGY